MTCRVPLMRSRKKLKKIRKARKTRTKRDFERVFLNVMGSVSGSEDFGFINKIYTDGFEDLIGKYC